MSSNRRNTRGFTLIELLTTMVMLTVLLFAAFSTFQIAIGRWDLQTSFNYSLQTVNAAELQVGSDVRNAVDFSTVASGGNTLYVLALPVDCQSGTEGCPSGTSTAANVEEINANNGYSPELVSGNLDYVDGPEVAYYLSDITGGPSVTGGTILWRATAPAGGSFTKDSSWSLVNSSVARCSGVTGFALENSTVNANVPTNAVELVMTVTGTSGHKSNSFSVAQDLYLGNHN